jgi:hypothetical protein
LPIFGRRQTVTQSSQAAPAVKAPKLLKEKPILAYPRLAHVLGVNEAIILQQIFFYVKINERKHKPLHFHNGKWWVYNSYKQWRDQHFPWLTPRGVQNIILKLETKGLIVSCQGLNNPQDRRKWYTIDFKKLDEFLVTSKIDSAQTARPTDIECTSNMHESADVYTESTTEKTQREEKRESACSTQPTNDTITPDGDSLSVELRLEERATSSKSMTTEAKEESSQSVESPQTLKSLPQSQPSTSPAPSLMREVIHYSFTNGIGGMAGRLSGFFAGTLKDHPRQRAWAQTQPSEQPATPQEIVALALWYSHNPDYSRSYAEKKGLPKTPSVLRERLDEFRDSVEYSRAMELAKPILERLCRGEKLRLEPVSEVKTPMPQRVESAQAYKPIKPTLDPAYLDRRQPGDLELAARLFGASS